MKVLTTHLASAVHGSEGIGVHALAAQSKLMGDLEQGVQAESLGEVGTDAGEHVVVEENIALDLLGQTLNGTRVGQTKLGPALGEGVDGITQRGRDWVGEEEGPYGIESGGHDDDVLRLRLATK